ncbi:polyribonucleotide nucleotidyltransferase [Hydrogenivirga sp. 128-5-R1-1]|uniref:polyribonucleotide nucleotidyltransferase n=1 Tax=Hydrogenivirga sp. 128-5-R1-1 TaxID=392423 RepID=UPI00015EF1AF|nr:polyribonucleotide nucleotidyltransferase [Hydrogenivirga sp. 128-5-R1-1]EDP74702.1 polyribonucleotide nucleotidyltransferase [Hydrogenivirga sp. 128-5-R1-1]
MEESARIGNSKEPIVIEVGRYAKQADGAVVVRQGGTAVLVTAVMSDEPNTEIDFTPLTVDYRERPSAYGRIPGGFVKREGKPSEREVLASRVIDRPLRPLFPEGFFHDVVVTALTLSADDNYDPDVLAITGASAALHISRIPFEGPIAGVRVCKVGGEFVANPTYEERKDADLEIVMAGTKDAIVMVEGGAKEVPEEVITEALFFGHEAIQEAIALQEKLRESIGVQKVEFEGINLDEELVRALEEECSERIVSAFAIQDKKERNKTLSHILEEFIEKHGVPEELHFNVKYFFKKLESKLMREKILAEGVRIDGRKPEEIRPISIEIHPFERPHGCAVFTRGQTQAYVTVTLGAPDEAQLIETIAEGEVFKRFMLHYNFPPFSGGEARSWGPPRRREIGHGALAERALEPVIPEEDDFPYIIRVVSDILESNGSTSMATVCGGSLALFDAGVPIKGGKHVSGIAMGLIKEGDRYVILSDILGDEDHLGDMDFKVAGTREGVTSIQMDIKIKGITKEIMTEALKQAKEGRLYILEKMYEAIPEPKKELSPYAPRIVIYKVPEEKAALVIGPGGSNVKKIYEETEVKIWVGEEGKVFLTGYSDEAIQKAIEMIENLVKDVEVGQVYEGKVTRVEPYGVFVEILPGKVGLLHVSKMAQPIKHAGDKYSVGDTVKVKVLEVDDMGRPKFTTMGLDGSSSPPEKKIEVGEVYEGKVTRVEPYGVFVEILPGKVGLLHVDNMKERTRDAREVFEVGDKVKVKVFELDERGRPKLTDKIE